MKQKWVYSYDWLDHLTGADNHGDDALDQTFTFDDATNMVFNSALGTYTYPAATAPVPHAPTSVAGVTFTYDAAGNMTYALNGRTIAAACPGPRSGDIEYRACILTRIADRGIPVSTRYRPTD